MKTILRIGIVVVLLCLIALPVQAQSKIVNIGSNASDALRVKNNTDDLVVIKGNTGNIGIGTANPHAKIHIYVPSGSNKVLLETPFAGHLSYGLKNVNTDYSLRLNGVNFQIVENENVRFNIQGGGDVGIGTTNPIGIFHVGVEAVAPNAFLVDKTSGNVGIGTSTPGTKLSIVGLLEYADNTAAINAGLMVGDLYRTGDILKIVH